MAHSHDDHAAHGHEHDDGMVHAHVSSVKFYVAILGALMFKKQPAPAQP